MGDAAEKGALNMPDNTENTNPPREKKPAASTAGGPMPPRTANTTGPLVHQVRIPEVLAILPVRDAVAFPGAVIPLSIGRDKSRRLLDDVMPGDKIIGVVTQKNQAVENPQAGDLYPVGTVVIVLKMLRQPDGQQSIVVHGLVRFRIIKFLTQEPYLKARIEPIADEGVPAEPNRDFDLLVESVRQAARRMIELSPNIPDEAAGILNEIDSPATLADFLAANLHESVIEKQALLEETDVAKRLTKVREKLATRIELLALEEKIQTQVRSSIDKTQRHYFLQEQLKAIQKELGQEDAPSEEIADLRQRITQAGVPPVVKKETDRELQRLAAVPPASPEYGVIRSFLETVAELPWNTSTRDDLDIAKARRILDRDHYDLDKIKKRIIEFLAVRRLNPAGHGPILCFLGPPGVGKTSLGKSIAESLGRKFVRMSLGGVRDEADIRGHRRTYIGAMPGRIIQELRKVGSNNPVMMLDEIDKLGADFRGDPSAALLEVLDPEQNFSFQDHYLGVPFDLSKTIFICTANYLEPVPPALKDRMETIEIPGYTQQDKLRIARKYLLPRQLKEHGVTRRQCDLPTAAIETIIDRYTREAGVRSLERAIGSVVRGVAAKIAEQLPPPPAPPSPPVAPAATAKQQNGRPQAAEIPAAGRNEAPPRPPPETPAEGRSGDNPTDASPPQQSDPKAAPVTQGNGAAGAAADEAPEPAAVAADPEKKSSPSAGKVAPSAPTSASSATPNAAPLPVDLPLSPPPGELLDRVPTVTVKPADLQQYLGPPVFESEVALRTATAGVVTGLAYTPFGGDILFVEATQMPGKGHLRLTGQIGAVMRESAMAAYSLLKNNAARLGLDSRKFQQLDVHVHVPAGAVPKDGPSAGVAMYTALASLFLNKPVRPDLAMTGEITLRGLVLPIGGVKEKVIAAQHAGIKTVLLPRRNEKNLQEVRNLVKKDLRFVFASTVEEVLRCALAGNSSMNGRAGSKPMPRRVLPAATPKRGRTT